MPSRERVMANRREHEGLPRLVLTDLELDGVSVLAIPYGTALAELTTWSTLTFARTFGQARRDKGAAQLVASRLSELLGPNRDPHETYRTTGSDRARFNASAFFRDEDWRVWTPNARVTTADFLQQHEPGNAGRNSLRTDVVVYDIAAAKARLLPLEDRLLHAVILGEVKREHASAAKAKETQVKPLLGPAKSGALAIYWDDVEQRIFWHDKDKRTREAPLAALPAYGVKFKGAPKLTIADLKPPTSVIDLFDRVEDVLHGEGVDRESRYTVMLQLLLAKLLDEMNHEGDPKTPLDIQDPIALGMDADVALEKFNELLVQAVAYFGAKLPKGLPEQMNVKPDTLVHVLPLLADKDLTHAAPRLMQDFFMKFAKSLYKWDMAQYFTPTTITSFIVSIVNPAFAEKVKDPACGSADFLMATHRMRAGRKQLVTSIFGVDNTETALQVGELNKVLHGTTAIDLHLGDSLEDIDSVINVDNKGRGKYDAIVCNPPFGKSITEKRPMVLAKFDLAQEWRHSLKDGGWEPTGKVRKTQQKGILFLEACIRMAKPGGRIAIILPNGYLGNRGPQYVVLRNYLLRQCRIAAIVSFPRFTFKQSGADVSASLLVLEKRDKPLAAVDDDVDYSIAVEMVERPGWELGNKVGRPTWKRDESDGTEIVVAGEKVLDFDLNDILDRLRDSDAQKHFSWLAGDSAGSGRLGWSVPITRVLADEKWTLDPKRHCKKYVEAQAAIATVVHFKLGDVVDVVDAFSATALHEDRDPAATYRYVEIGDVGAGTYTSTDYRGWQLPERAKHDASAGDIFVGGIWNSVSKWFMAGGDTEALVVTNGFTKLRVKPGKKDYLVDVVAGLCLEAYSVQMRGVARGSDGLAEITNDDLQTVLLPRLKDPAVRAELQAFVDQLKKGHTTVKAAVENMSAMSLLPLPDVPRRHSHVVLV